MSARFASWFVLMAVLPATLVPALEVEKVDSEKYFHERAGVIVKDFLDWRPGNAAALGLHEYDGKAVIPTAEAVAAELKRLKRAHAEIASLETALVKTKATGPALLEARVLRAALAGEIFSIDEMHAYTRNPMTYAAGFDVSIYFKRDFAPLEQRLESATRILGKAGELYAAARINLDEVLPRSYVETAILIARGTAEFVSRDLLETVRTQVDGAKAPEARLTEKAAALEVAALRVRDDAKDFADWLERERLPKADASFALGKEKFRRFLASTELVDLDPEKILAIGQAELKREQARFAAAARVIDPIKPAIEVFKQVQRDHPTAEKLIPEIAARLESARAYVVAHDLVTIPSEVRARVEETPRFLRASTFASMDSPGAFEERAKDAYYYVTPVEPTWSKEQAEEWLTAFNYATADSVNVHEAYPGHYVQFLHVTASEASRIGKIFTSYGFVEGWAHYAEQMMVEEGFGAVDGDKVAAAKTKLGQSDEALLRICRLCTAVMLHCQGASVEDAAKFFRENCYYEAKPSMQEAVRGTFDPGFLNYTLGKLQILKLRDDWRKQEGAKFTLKRFHDELLRHGSPQVRLLRGVMLRDAKSHDQILK